MRASDDSFITAKDAFTAGPSSQQKHGKFLTAATANEVSKDGIERSLVFDRSIDMSVMEDEKNTSEFRRLRTIQEVEDEKC